MSASGADQVHNPVLVATDSVILHEVPVPVDGQILKDVSNHGSNETPESVVVGVVSLNKTDASNGAVGPTTSADEKENGLSHEEPASIEDGGFVKDKEAIVHETNIALEKTEDVQDAPVVEVPDTITIDNVDDTTLNKDDEIITVKDTPSTPEVASIATAEQGIPVDSDCITPIANTMEPNTIDDSVNDSAIEIPAPVLEKQDCTKDGEDDAAPADGAKLVETRNHNEAVKRNTTDNVDDTSEIMNHAANGEILAIAEVALQEKGDVVNIGVDIVPSAAEGGALVIDEVPETKEENASIAMAEAPQSNATDSAVTQVDAADVSVEPAAMKDNIFSDHVEVAAATSEAVVETQEDDPKATVEGTIEQTQGEDIPTVAEEHVPVVEAALSEANLREDGAVVATETEIAVEPNDAGVTIEEIEQRQVDETSAEHTNNMDAEPLVEEVDVGHEVEPAAEDVSNIEEAGRHEEPVRDAVEEEPKVTEFAGRVVEKIPVTAEDAVVAVDETTETPETVEGPTNDTKASISTPAEVESITSEANIAPDVTYEEGRLASEIEPVVANETITAPVDEVPTIAEGGPVDAGAKSVAEVEAEASLKGVSASIEGESVPASDTVHEVPVEEEAVPASKAITDPVIESEEVVPTADDVQPATPETNNEETFAREIEPVTADEEVIATPVGNEEASVQIETEPIAVPVDGPITAVAESEAPLEDAAVCVEAEPLPADEVNTPVIESEEVDPTSDEIGDAAPETSVETYEEAPTTIKVEHEVENIAEANGAITSALVEPVAETEGVTEKASEVGAAGHDDVTQESIGLIKPESIPANGEVAATVVKVAEELALAPVEFSEETTTVNVENEEILASVVALDETTVVEVETAPIEAPVQVTLATSLEAEHDVTGEAAPIVLTEDDSEPSVPGEEITTTTPEVETAAPQVDDEATHEKASAPVEADSVIDIATPTVQAVDEAAPLSIHGPDTDDDAVAETQATHTEAPGEIALDTEPSTAVAEGEAVAEETPVPTTEEESAIVYTEATQETPASIEEDLTPTIEDEAAGVEDALETSQEGLATLEAGSKSPPLIVDAENAVIVGTSQAAESVPQTDEGVSVPIAPIIAVAANEIVQEIVAEGEPAIDEEKERASSQVTGRVVNGIPAQDTKEETPYADSKDSTEVALEDTSVVLATSIEETTLATAPELEEEAKIEEQTLIEAQQPQAGISLAENAPSPADVLESVGEKAIDVGSTDVPTPVAGEIVTAAGQADEVAMEKSTSAPVVESVADVPELRTGLISIETSLDTPPFIPVLDSGIEFREQESGSCRLSSIAEELERPKSPWPSEFQVSSVVGSESSGVGDAGPVPESTEPAETGEPASVSLMVVGDTPVKELVPTIGSSGDVISVGQPPLEPPPHPWTPSYFVHSQGSPTRVELTEDFPSIDEPVPAHEPSLGEQDELASISVEGCFKAQVTNHNESSEEDVTSTVGSHVPSTEEVDLTEVNEEVTGGLDVAVDEEGVDEDVDQEASQQMEANLTVHDAPARSWTPSYSTHSQGTPLVAMKELEDVPLASVITHFALSAERSVENHAENTVTVDSEYDNTGDEQINTTENEVYGQPSIEVSHTNPMIALEGQKIEDETLNPQHSSQAETTLNLENELPPRPWTPSYSVHSQGSPAATPKEVEEALLLDAEAIEQFISESTATTLLPIDAREIAHSEPITAEFDEGEISSSVDQSQNNSNGEVVDYLEPLPPAAAQAATTGDSDLQLNEVQEGGPGSNALQTRQSHAVAGTEDIAKNEQFFLFGLRAIVAYLWVLPRWLSMTSSDHSRQGSSSSSSSSSKFFLGGWFTPKPKEGRTSFDVAQGEFAPSPKATTSNDVFETLGSEVTDSDSSTAINVAMEDDGQKRKWCVVM